MNDAVRIHRSYARAAFIVACSALLACSDDGSTDPDPDFTITVASNAPATTLGTETSFAVRLASSDFDGTVDLAVTGAPAGWAVTLDETSVDLGDGTPVIVEGPVTIASDGAAAPAGQELTVTATGAPGTRSVTIDITVADEYVLPIAAGTGDGPHWPDHAGGVIALRVGTTLRVRNDDATFHRIHPEENIDGFAHQPESMAAGGSYLAVIGGTGTEAIYCHDHGHADHVTIVVE